ncbi:MAG: ATP-dependent sacrificial sulfur transferase LarE [Desulfobacterales bacterium]|nr:MAG: ATP-dependent sacrificial sulfur transferase LarE [Desulfobacterales bacterium]
MKTAQIEPESRLKAEIDAGKLENYFSQYHHVIVAYSGGVDSALLAYAAHRVLGDRMVAVLADSPSLSRREYRCALDFARIHGIPLEIIRTQELKDPHYQRNQGDRCYYCKQALFKQIKEFRKQLEGSINDSFWPIVYGTNRDDLRDYRPGIQAAHEASILAPYLKLGFDKRTIRAICGYYRLDIAAKPAMPCMASRIAYGQEVTAEKLNQVEQAEDFLYDLGLRVLRVRHHGDTARIEIPPQDFGLLLENREKITEKLHALGLVYVALDLDGFKSGSLNAVLQKRKTSN